MGTTTPRKHQPTRIYMIHNRPFVGLRVPRIPANRFSELEMSHTITTSLYCSLIRAMDASARLLAFLAFICLQRGVGHETHVGKGPYLDMDSVFAFTWTYLFAHVLCWEHCWRKGYKIRRLSNSGALGQEPETRCRFSSAPAAITRLLISLSNTYSSFATITNLGVDDKGRRCDAFFFFIWDDKAV